LTFTTGQPPDGHKITLLLEESGLDNQIRPINIRQGDQFETDFLKIAPNNRIPAIFYCKPVDGCLGPMAGQNQHLVPKKKFFRRLNGTLKKQAAYLAC
jgi:hypothetical protein